MTSENNNKKKGVKKILWVILLLVAIGAVSAWYIFTDTFDDTATQKAAYTFNATAFINEFQQNDSAANKKYAEQIITVNGRISEIEFPDTTANVKMTDTTTGSYIIFAFQPQDAAVVKTLKEGDSVSIKGSCSGGTYSKILEAEKIDFKRSTINK